MSRYRPSRTKSSPYITEQGYDRLQQELKYLWKDKRPAVTRKVSEAAALGDRSENAEYIYGKRALREIDSRIQFLSRRLDDVQVIRQLPTQRDRVFFGAWVTLQSDRAENLRYRIVGADEFDRDPDYISIDAPLARALVGKSLGDQVLVEVQTQTTAPRILETQPSSEPVAKYTVIAIEYD